MTTPHHLISDWDSPYETTHHLQSKLKNTKGQAKGDSMKNKRCTYALTILMTSFALFGVGCMKKRPDQWAQNQGRYLTPFSKLDGKVFSVQTFGKIARDNNSQASLTPKVNKAAEGEMLYLDYVKFETKADLLPKDTPFRGRENTTNTYQIVYKITDKFLKVMKVAKANEIPFTERSYAEKMSDGRLAVPLGGYEIQHFKKVKALNGDNKETNQFIEFPLQDKEGSDYVRINRTNFIQFRSIAKNDIFSTSFFDFYDETQISKQQTAWYFVETPIVISGRGESGEGLWSTQDTESYPASRVYFVRNQNEILVVNASKEKGYREDTAHHPMVLKIPARFVDFRAVKIGSDTGLAEEAHEENHYALRKQVELNLSAVTSPTFPFGDKRVVDVQVSREDGPLGPRRFLSFTVEVNNEGFRGKVRYSFFEVPKNVPSGLAYNRRSFHWDDKRFLLPMFRPMPAVLNYKIRTTDDFSKLFMMIKHNTKTGPVIYHVSEQTPDKYLPLIRYAVDTWNLFLEKYNVKGVRLKLEGKRAPLGDLRYNVIHVSESAHEAAFNGVNQSVVDDQTGEIVSTYVQYNATTVKSVLTDYIYSYLNDKLGRQIYRTAPEIDLSPNKESLRSPFAAFLELGFTSPLDLVLPSETIAGLKSSSAEKTIGQVLRSRFGFRSELEEQKASSEVATSNNIKDLSARDSVIQRFNCEPATVGSAREKDLQEFCGKGSNQGGISLMEYVDSLKGQRLPFNFSFDSSIIEACVGSLAINSESPRRTMVHEIGHSLGLGHNFMGNVDEKNFYSDEELPPGYDEYHFSSVMDYPGVTHPRMPYPGRYDIAAIRFIYDASVEDKNNPSVSIPIPNVEKSLIQNGLVSRMRVYLACDDADAEAMLDPLCQRFDYGSTPLEIVENQITEFNRLFKAVSYRFDNFALPRLQWDMVLMPLKRMYDEWRSKLGAFLADTKAAGDNFFYLERSSVKDFDINNPIGLLSSMARDPKYKADYALYRPAAVRIREFLLNDLAFMPNRYCLVKKNGYERVLLYELSKVRSSIPQSFIDPLTDCRDPRAEAFLAKLGFKVIDDIGHELISQRFSNDNLDARREIDINGSLTLRLAATELLTRRVSLNPKDREKGLAPNFLDEPDFRIKFINDMLNRALQGVKIPSADLRSPNFREENLVVSLQNMLMRRALQVPVNTIETVKRNEPFEVVMTQYSCDRVKDKVAAYTEFGSNCAVIQDFRSDVSLRLLRKHMQISRIFKNNGEGENLWTNEEKKDFLESVSSLIPSKANSFMALSTMSAMDYVKTILSLLLKAVSPNPSIASAFDEEFRLETLIFQGVWQELANKILNAIPDEKKEEVAKELNLVQTVLVVSSREKSLDENGKQELEKLKAHVFEVLTQAEEGLSKLQIVLPLLPMLENSPFKDSLPRFKQLFSAEDFIERMDRYFLELEGDLRMYKEDPSELEAQSAMILDFLLPYAKTSYTN